MQCHLHCKQERNGAQRRTKVSAGRSMILALELLRLAKSPSQDKEMLCSEEIKPVAIILIELHLSGGIN